MIFRPELARMIREGRKTMTRRPARRDEPCRYKPGKTYAVQPGRGQSATCRIHITDVRKELAGEITYTDARAEGFATTDDFKAYWVSLYDAAWLKHENQMLDEAENDEGVVLDRDTWIMRRSLHMFEADHDGKRTSHANTPVWVIRFELDHAEVPRLLALRSDELYVTSAARAIPHEPEAVDTDTQRRITAEAGMRTDQWQTVEQARRDHDRALLSREDQIARLHRAARLRGSTLTIRNELRLLETMRNTATDEAFNRKVTKTEKRVFGIAA